MRKKAVFSLVLMFIVGCAAGEAPERPNQHQVVKMQSQIMPAYVLDKHGNVFDTVYTQMEVECFNSVYNATVQYDEQWKPYIFTPPRFVLDSTKGVTYVEMNLAEYEKQLTMQEVIQ